MANDEIYSIGYRPPRDGDFGRSPILPIARQVISGVLARTATKVLGAAAGASVLFHAVWLVGTLLFAKATDGELPVAESVIGSSNEIVATFLSIQYFVAGVLLLAVAPGVIADDRNARCWIVYFSRPLSRHQYVAGKLLGVVCIPAALIFVPTIALCVAAFGISPAATRPGLFSLGGPALAVALLACLTLASLMVGLSASFTKARVAATAFAGGLFGLPAVSGILYSNGADWAGYLDPSRSLQTIANSWLDPSRSMAGQLLAQGETHLSPTLGLIAVGVFICFGLGLSWYALSGDIDV